MTGESEPVAASRGWNFADIWEAVATAVPERDAQVQGDRRITWGEMDRRANGIAATLLDAGVSEQDKVAQYLYNCPEFMESQFAIFKAGLVPVNTNYRYTTDELLYLWDNADAVAVIFHGTFTPTIEEIRDRLPRIRTWIWVDDHSGPRPEWAVAYEEAATSHPGRAIGPWGRSGEHIYMLYTGGTTGMPKGVMWEQGELTKLHRATDPEFPEAPDPDYVRAKAVESADVVGVPCCPLMHGTGAFTSHTIMHLGGTLVTLEGRHFEATELLDTIERERVQRIAIVGDAFAKPILAALEAEPNRWDLSSLVAMISSGVMWSAETKAGLLAHHPGMILVDAFSSSEALGMGQSVSSAAGTAGTAKFELGERAVVIDDEGNLIEPGSGRTGRVAVRGILPSGYYKDPEKTARTFIEINGERFSTPGDYARVEADGSLTLLGRGSVCINTAGEKVYPEEVEEALKRHPSVHDAVVVGVPDDRFGQAVTGVVELREGYDLHAEELISTVKEHLASYKAPKRVVSIPSIGRAANGKVDYKRLTTFACEALGIDS